MKDTLALLEDNLPAHRFKMNFKTLFGVPTNKVYPCLIFDEKQILNYSGIRHLFSFPGDKDCLALDKCNHHMKYKDTIELLERHPHFFQSLQYKNDCEYHRPWRKTFVFAQPRSGSTLLMRLMSGACLTKMVGDKAPQYYESALNIYENVRDNNGHYLDAVSECEKSGIFPDEYRGYESQKRETWNAKIALGQLLFANSFGSGYAKATCIGLGSADSDDVVKRFADMLRELYDDDEDLKIVWLTREPKDIVASLKSKGIEFDEDSMLAALTKQRTAYSKAYEVGDVVLKYEDWIKEPVKTLMRLNPVYQPNPQAVERIMANVIR